MVVSEKVVCPYCGTIQKDHTKIRSWKYSTYQVTKYECKCGKNFNFYKGKTKSWINPKPSTAKRWLNQSL